MNRGRIQRLMGAAVAGSLVIGQLVWAEATNHPDALALRAQADRWAGAGAWASALSAYEEIVRNDPALVPTLAPVMVRLALQGKQAEAAVRWAGEVVRHHPRPAAYWAGVYAGLGRTEEALRWLDQAESGATSLRERLEVMWQRADLLVQVNRLEAAQQEWRRAAQAAEGTPDEAVARRRLERGAAASVTSPAGP